MLSTFPIDQVNELRTSAQKISQFPQQRIIDDAPFTSLRKIEGWNQSEVDPMKMLRVFTALRLKPNYVLRAYQYQAGNDGNGVVWALRKDAPFPHPDNCPKLTDGIFNTPKPPGALDNYMEVVEGDDTPWSYLSASLFAREAQEFGAMWHGCSWSTHEILGTDPSASDRGQQVSETAEFDGSRSEFTWLAPKPDLWLPSCQQEENSVVVQFYSFTSLEQEQIVRHRDVYQAGQYTFYPNDEAIAVGDIGYIF